MRTYIKEVLDDFYIYSVIKKNDVIPANKIWILVGMNDVDFSFQADKYM